MREKGLFLETIDDRNAGGVLKTEKGSYASMEKQGDERRAIFSYQ